MLVMDLLVILLDAHQLLLQMVLLQQLVNIAEIPLVPGIFSIDKVTCSLA